MADPEAAAVTAGRAERQLAIAASVTANGIDYGAGGSDAVSVHYGHCNVLAEACPAPRRGSAGSGRCSACPGVYSIAASGSRRLPVLPLTRGKCTVYVHEASTGER
ncbi:MAG: hypothetical protein ACRDOI_01175 [Trebonia sp.]